MKRFLIVAGLLVTTPAQAEPDPWRWNFLPGTVTSSGLANLRATFLGTTGLSWPDGSQAVVTFWRREGKAHDTGEDIYLTYRCVDYFNVGMESTGGKCEAAGAGLLP
jgi:hypothetical protein